MKVRNWTLAMVSMVILWGAVSTASAQERRDDHRPHRHRHHHRRGYHRPN